MRETEHSVWFWQRILSPHMAGLAEALAGQGLSVTYVAEEPMAADLAQRGWSAPRLEQARLILAPTPTAYSHAVQTAPADAIHICQGLRGNGLVGVAQRALIANQRPFWIFMERVDDAGWRGALRRLMYRGLFLRWRGHIAGVLAAGDQLPEWVSARGVPGPHVYPFAYFLPEHPVDDHVVAIAPDARAYKDGQPASSSAPLGTRGTWRVLFVGQLIERKGLDLLIQALATLTKGNVELVVIGTGSQDARLRRLAGQWLPGRVTWQGGLPMAEIPRAMAQADCLVLPSHHDGWGAVASEALLVGTPVICSDHCGVAGVVRASGVGGVFRGGDSAGLASLLSVLIARGPWLPQARGRLAAWASCLGAQAGARYLRRILAYQDGLSDERPLPPWLDPPGPTAALADEWS